MLLAVVRRLQQRTVRALLLSLGLWWVAVSSLGSLVSNMIRPLLRLRAIRMPHYALVIRNVPRIQYGTVPRHRQRGLLRLLEARLTGQVSRLRRLLILKASTRTLLITPQRSL